MRKLAGGLILAVVLGGTYAYVGYEVGYLNALIGFGKAVLVVSGIAGVLVAAALLTE
jgi:hypothetical protein